MCLGYIDEEATAAMPEAAIRYKVVAKDGSKYWPLLMGYKPQLCGWGIPEDPAVEKASFTLPTTHYFAGVHTFVNREDAIVIARRERMVFIIAVKVLVRGPIASGTELRNLDLGPSRYTRATVVPVDVWKEMTILEEL